MADKEKILAQISLYLSRTLCLQGVGSSQLKIARSLTNADEYMQRELTSEEDDHEVMTGSLVEGSMVEGSDVDTMFVLAQTTAVTGSLDKRCCELIMDMENVRPGFSKLRLYNRDRRNVHNAIKCSLIHTDDGSVYVASDKFREICVKSDRIKLCKPSDSSVSVAHNGPCSTVIFKNSYGTVHNDNAHAIECCAWPEKAKEWLSRPRLKGWPSENEVSKLKEMACYLLPVGDPTSTNCHLEWRFAFVTMERELVWSFNDTQIHCLVLLKLIKNTFLESVAPDQLSSFYLKTIIFWESEEHGLDMWCHENLVDCVHQCLETLRKSIQALDLPHYIYRKRNLLHSKFCDQKQQTAVLQKISKIQENLIDCIKEIAFSSEEQLRDIDMIKDGNELKDYDLNSDFAPFRELILGTTVWEYAHITLSTMLAKYITVNVNDKFYRLIEDFQNDKIRLEDSHKETILCMFSIRIGNFLLSSMCCTEVMNRKHELRHSAFHYFEEGLSLDSISGPLYLATFFFTCKKYKQALKIITEVCSNSNKERSYYIGMFTSKPSLLPSSDKTRGEMLILGDTVVAYDVFFTSEDFVFVPDCVKFEFAYDSLKLLAVVHPLVYAYCLYFQICLNMQKKDGCSKAIQKLSNFINVVPEEVRNPHQTFNLLGFCFYRYGWYGVATHCFRTSLQVYNDKRNAAALHLWFMFLHMEKRY